MILGTGVDAVEIERIRGVLGRQKERFIRRVFTEAETAYCLGFRDPAPHFAARFAAKEALFKALGTGWTAGVAWLDAEVLRLQTGAPSLELHGEAANRAARMGARRTHVSLSHSETIAVATVLLEG